jgi:hypothetical protein
MMGAPVCHQCSCLSSAPGSAHDPLRLIEPRSNFPNHTLARRHAVREKRRKESIAINSL